MIKHFTIYNQSGDIIQSGQLSAEDFNLQKPALGESIIEAESDPQFDKVDPITKQVLKGAKPQPVLPPPLPEYVTARTNAYPSVTDQLDMLWHSMDAGEVPKAEPFYSSIKAVKDTYPKDITNADSTLLYNIG